MPAEAGARRWLDSRPVFAALADEMRLRIVGRLCDEGPLSITRLAEGSPVSRQAVAKHLRVLAEAALARGSRDGREHVWELDPRGVEDARRALERISHAWDDRLGRLRALVERPAPRSRRRER